MKDLSFLIEKIETVKRVHRVMIFTGAVALFSGLFLYFVYFPKTEKIQMVQRAISQLDIKLNEARTKARNLPRLEAEAASIEKEFKAVSRLLPDKKEIPSLLKHVNHLGKESDLKFMLFRPKKEKSCGFYFEIPISIKVAGQYYNVLTFFDKISKISRIVNVFDVKMKPKKAMSTDLNTSFTAVTYRFRGENEKDLSKQKRRNRRRR
jgi:type IV pilus assembly protein PilO